ncbi:MAG TPA: hypothetical protein VEW45_05615 [Candidatus Dormibacteraeota bacterium]|nr:hypothetical protein [Candidatus Dormibacteraeota bacterium]
MAEPGPIDPFQRRLAEGRLLAALRRLHRREPLRSDMRVDAVIAELRNAPRQPAGHRGSAPVTLDDTELRSVVDDLVASGALVRAGHRVRLPEHEPTLDPEMRVRVERLLAGLREAGAAPPRIEGSASRLGIPPTVLSQLRSAGELVAIAPGIDYPHDVWVGLRARVEAIAERGPLTVRRVREQLRTPRRHAEAILDFWRAERRRRSPRRGG